MDKWKKLAADLSEENALLGSRLKSSTLQTQYEAGLGWIIEEETDIVACTFLWTSPIRGWHELGTVWASPSRRGDGLGAQVFRSCTKDIQRSSLNAFLITHNSRIVHLAQFEKWVEATRLTWGIVPWSASCDPCDRFPNVAKPECSIRTTAECRMFYIENSSFSV